MSVVNDQDGSLTSQTHEVAGVPLDFGSPHESALAVIKAAVFKIGTNGTRDGFKLCDRLMKAIPGLRES